MKEPMFIEVIKAEYLDGYRLKLWFNNSDVMEVDLKDSLDCPAFEPLNNLDHFRNFQLGFGTVTWLDGRLDLAPEYLHDIGHLVA